MTLTQRLLDRCEDEGIAIEYGSLGEKVAGVYYRCPTMKQPVIGLDSSLAHDTRLRQNILEKGIEEHCSNSELSHFAIYLRDDLSVANERVCKACGHTTARSIQPPNYCELCAHPLGREDD